MANSVKENSNPNALVAVSKGMMANIFSHDTATKVAGSTSGFALSGENLWQVVCTHVSLSPSSIS